MVKLQTCLERLCYAFGQKNMREVLQGRGWDCAESAELNHWMDEFLRDATLFSMAGNRESLEELFKSVAEIRHTAVYRKRTDSEGIRKFLSNAVALAELLNVEEHISIIDKFQSIANRTLSDLDHNKSLLQSRLEHERLRIAAERIRLDQEESVAIAEMREKDHKYQELMGTSLIQAIRRADGTAKAALSNSDSLTESYYSDRVINPYEDEDEDEDDFFD